MFLVGGWPLRTQRQAAAVRAAGLGGIQCLVTCVTRSSQEVGRGCWMSFRRAMRCNLSCCEIEMAIGLLRGGGGDPLLPGLSNV
jgi:hypothetical protein